MKKALIHQNKVIQIENTEFPVALPLQWVDCPNTTQVGYGYSNGSFTSNEPQPVTQTLEQVKKDKLVALAAYRYQKETGGLTVNGITIATDDRTKTLLLGARLLADQAIKTNTQFSIKWKTEQGFIEIPASVIIAMSDALSQFVQQCFNLEAQHTININALTDIDSVNNYDFTTMWG